MKTPSRRIFLKTAGAAAASALIVSPSAAWSYAANEKLCFACIGIGGMGTLGVKVASHEQIVAAADVDSNRAADSIKKIKDRFADAKIYTDYRKLFDEQKHLDAVWVATPDHSHFPATFRALDAGLAVYCEKPLCHDIYEARKLRELAKAKKVATQMGNGGHSGEHIRLLCEWIWQGSLGDVTEAHARPSGPDMDMGSRNAGQPVPVPAGLDWDLWQCLVKEREFRTGIHPVGWRGWLDYGTGFLGDWFCHNADSAVWALRLYEADTVEVEAESGKPTAENHPRQAKVVRRFPKRGEMAPVTVRWFQNMELPHPPALEAEREPKDFASVYYGTKGVAVAGSHMKGVRLIPESFQQQVGRPKQVLPRVEGGHQEDFLRAIREGRKSCADFDYSARLTEIMLLGNVALRAGEKFTYDFRTGKCNSDKANALLRREPRKGWEFGYV